MGSGWQRNALTDRLLRCPLGGPILLDTTAFLHQQIPITQAMGVRVESCDPNRFVVTAPLAINHNHLGTAFGGSLSAIASVAGYGFLWQELADQDCHLVIRESSIQYRSPVRSDIRATCHRPEEAQLSAFKTKFAATGKARITLNVTIHDSGVLAVEFAGIYVALK